MTHGFIARLERSSEELHEVKVREEEKIKPGKTVCVNQININLPYNLRSKPYNNDANLLYNVLFGLIGGKLFLQSFQTLIRIFKHN